MKPSPAVQRRRVIEELEWHTDDPEAAYDLLTPLEVNEIIRLGFMPRELMIDLRGRILRARKKDPQDVVD